MKNIFLFVCVFVSLLSCNEKKINQKAQDLDKKATKIYIRNYSNTDSLKYSLSLVDSAIKLQDDHVNFYITKTMVLNQLKKYDQVVDVYDKILHFWKNNCLILLAKGVSFERLNKLDSAFHNYQLALKYLDKARFKDPKFKEYQKILLYGLLKDSINFNLSLQEFKTRFKNEKDFSYYYQDLINFDRINYIKSF